MIFIYWPSGEDRVEMLLDVYENEAPVLINIGHFFSTEIPLRYNFQTNSMNKCKTLRTNYNLKDCWKCVNLSILFFGEGVNLGVLIFGEKSKLNTKIYMLI